VPDANELKLLASRQEQRFHEKFGYPASEVPGIWVGQQVAVNMLGGRGGDRQLAPTRASGMLEAISLDGSSFQSRRESSLYQGNPSSKWSSTKHAVGAAG
jgi:hypothetical protein